MSTKFFAVCDVCGAEETTGDEKGQKLFGLPSQPGEAYFRLTRTEDDTRETFSLDLCLVCGDELYRKLREVLPAKYWNLDEND